MSGKKLLVFKAEILPQNGEMHDLAREVKCELVGLNIDSLEMKHMN